MKEAQRRVEKAHYRVEEAHHQVKDVKGYMISSTKQRQQCSKTPYFKKRRADVNDQESNLIQGSWMHKTINVIPLVMILDHRGIPSLIRGGRPRPREEESRCP
ncbi:hypothetical protein ACLB2K_002458 [Fragaria x ananassa]